MNNWSDKLTPAEEMARWHTGARERDNALLALGPIDESETTDGPWASVIEPCCTEFSDTGCVWLDEATS